MTDEGDGDDLRAQVRAFMPVAMQRALTSYEIFMGKNEGADPKGFAAHHNACKAALAHVQLLMRVAAWADCNAGNTGAGMTDGEVEAMIRAAQAAVDGMEFQADD